MGSAEEFESARLRRADRRNDQADRGGRGEPAFLGRALTRPIAGKFFLAGPVAVSGSEAEGSSGSLGTPGPSIPVFWPGGDGSIGEYYICRFLDFRWVAEMGKRSGPASGGGGVDILSCFCQDLPQTLSLTAAYQGCGDKSTTLIYGPPPAGAAELGGPAVGGGPLPGGIVASPMMGYWSEEVDNGTNTVFYYYLTCRYNVFTLQKLFARTIDPSQPYIGGVGFRQWVISNNNFNSCSPFQLTCEYVQGFNDGTNFPPSCAVAINKSPAGRDGRGHCDASLPPEGSGSYGQLTPPATGGTTASPSALATGADRPDSPEQELVVARYQEDATWAEGAN